MRYLIKFNEHRVSAFDRDNWKKLLPKELSLITSTGNWVLKVSDSCFVADNLIQAIYYQNTPEQSGDVNSDGEPDILEIDIHIVKNNDGTEANPDKLRLNIDITYGDAMVFEFTIDEPNNVNVYHYTSLGSKFDPESVFAFSDDSIKSLVELFNRFSDKYKLTSKDFTFLDTDPNSYQPNY